MKDNLIRYTMKIDSDFMKKFGYVAAYNGRTKNKEIEQIMKEHIKAFEKEHGEINISEIK